MHADQTPVGPRLWEIDHPYYCTEGNFYARPSDGLHTEYPSWAAFYEDWADTDPDLNLVFRWDWKRPNPDDYEDGEELPPETLAVYWVLQRKAILRSTECVIDRADEPAVRTWLTDRARTIAAIWAPISPGTEGGGDRG
ncbi:hypothetical protein [Streptomyces sp. 35G-GA-8]|uniref:hypothetical protein n=1 Tax=Streptomyces sp. 35G-GA-8 TaxID=2939434 RepID=UPI00201F9C4A|nr:hypothetical protein [Streptomyces sp. 35G-GA-8]MCL7377424.1 hypothetical protein [Streptomyces sp. 35G-GA-8]